MKLDQNQLQKYRSIMNERIKKANTEDHIIHGYMVYQCEHCHNIYVMWLEKGLEYPRMIKKLGIINQFLSVLFA